MRTLLTIITFLTLVSLLPAQDFEGMGYLKAGTETLGPIKIKQNVGGSVSIGQWPRTTVFIYDEYSAVIDSTGKIVIEGGLPSSASSGDKFLAAKEKWMMDNVAATQEKVDEVVTSEEQPDRQRKKRNAKEKKERPAEEEIMNELTSSLDTSSTQWLPGERRRRLGFGATVGYFNNMGFDGFSYGATANLTFPLGQRFRVGGAVDLVVYHDYIFKKTITIPGSDMDEYYGEDYPGETASYKVPEGFAGAAQLRPFAGADFGCFRGGYQPVLVIDYHSIFGTNTEFYPFGLGFGFLRGPVQVDFFAALKPAGSMYTSSTKLFGASVTFGNRSGYRE